ncbi:Abi family protein [Lactiplantibacillus plantarum]|jgi:abortive infection bacteriophage resistance protein|uniref:Abi family protein n=1 Tax=Lactiplantibacillus plantarum TaxID=1590 RepID=UPI00070E44E9|nr:Abi family protein [Lactiplantibacillus plantarum]KRN36141.1 hypothetical protein IV39_GL000539 [Lactiplantibacillus plantarum]
MSDKPFRTYEQQIELLKERNLIIQNDDLAKEILQDRSYYGLINGFKSPYTYRDKNGKEFFNNGVSLDDLVAEYQIESDLKNILLRYSLLAEIRLKEATSNVLAQDFGVDPINYLDRRHFTNRTGKRNSILGQINSTLKKTDNMPTKYYREHHDVVPPWILLSNLMLGPFRLLYISLKEPESDKIVKHTLYLHDSPSEMEKAFVSNGLGILLAFRNNLAHGSRLLKFRSTKSMMPYNSIISVVDSSFLSKSEYDSLNIGKNDLFSLIIVITFFLGVIDRPIFINSITNLMQTFASDSTIQKNFNNYITESNLPPDLSFRLNSL